jgi:Domain of unknown function (DUF4340)
MIMRKTIIAAAVLLVLQIGLAVALNVESTGYETFTPDTPFVRFDADTITSLDITDGDGKQLVMEKNETGWILPKFYQASADKAQVTALLTKLAGMKQGLAVATSAAAAKRFKVAEDSFERHVVLKAGDKVAADLYIGSSPGFRQVHARKAGQKDIVNILLSSFELMTSPEKWIAKDTLKLKQEDLAKVSFADFVLDHKDGGWQLDGLQEGQKTNTDEAKVLIEKICGLIIQSVVDPQKGAELLAKEPGIHYTVTGKDGSETTYAFAKGKDNYLVLKVSNRDQYFKVYSLQLDYLRQMTRDKLIVQPEAAQTVEAKPESARADAAKQEPGKPEAATK